MEKFHHITYDSEYEYFNDTGFLRFKSRDGCILRAEFVMYAKVSEPILEDELLSLNKIETTYIVEDALNVAAKNMGFEYSFASFNSIETRGTLSPAEMSVVIAMNYVDHEISIDRTKTLYDFGVKLRQKHASKIFRGALVGCIPDEEYQKKMNEFFDESDDI